MVTTDCRIPIDTFASDPPELVHLTGSFQVVARVTLEEAADRPAHVEVCCDAARVRGVGLETGTKYEAKGAYRVVDDLPKLPAPFCLISAFEFLRHGLGDPQPTRLLLVVPFRLTVHTDGKVMAGIDEPTLISCAFA